MARGRTHPLPGSSPRVRGTLLQPNLPHHCRRFIPARAGNTWPSPAPSGRRSVHPRACGEHPGRSDLQGFVAVHPRACGEHALLRHPAWCVRGSSPRVRGTLRAAEGAHSEPRFIPARAGNTQFSASCVLTVTVHPRACGEHALSQWLITAPSGSSPRVRGTPVRHRLADRRSRFIPARAGNTRTRR